jgi:DNA-binding Xre family transcriptional regulator
LLKIELRIKEAITSRDLNQKTLAELTGIRPTAISMLARGNVERLTIDHLERIANALEIKDINELLTLTESDN